MKPENWLVPLIVEVGIGTSWGTVIDNPVFTNGKISGASSLKLAA